MNIIYPILFMVLIFVSSSIPGNSSIFRTLLPYSGLNNLLHTPLYGVLTYLWAKYFTKKGKSLMPSLIHAAIISFTYGIFEEFHQSMIADRVASIGDVMLNAAGILVCVFIYISLKEKRND